MAREEWEMKREVNGGEYEPEERKEKGQEDMIQRNGKKGKARRGKLEGQKIAGMDREQRRVENKKDV